MLIGFYEDWSSGKRRWWAKVMETDQGLGKVMEVPQGSGKSLGKGRKHVELVGNADASHRVIGLVAHFRINREKMEELWERMRSNDATHC